jgi:UDP-N-acetylmuramate dehydrogenase
MTAGLDLHLLREVFGDRLQERVALARFTAARLGGPAEALLEVGDAQQLAQVVDFCWRNGVPLTILGGGTNVLVSDAGVRGLVVLNHARRVIFDDQGELCQVRAESGANFGLIARQAAQRGLAGLEWAAGIPGTLGGAVFGNAGAHGKDMTSNLLVADILHHRDRASFAVRETWPLEKFAYTYRSSLLKRTPGAAVVLEAVLKLERSDPQVVQEKMEEYVSYRKRTQPPGASMGSMFKNPPGDYAGRLIEAAGLKGTRMGGAEISTVHANFFINQEQAQAADIYGLIQLARTAVSEKFGVNLELEIELLGEW